MNRETGRWIRGLVAISEIRNNAGDDIAEYVIDCNVTRRNMSTGARAMATAMVLSDDGRRENGRWVRGSVDIATSGNSESRWRTAVSEAGTVLDFKPELAEKVAHGELTLKDAYEQAKAIKTGQERGEIRAHGKQENRGNRYVESRELSNTQVSKSSPYDYASHAELHGQDDDGDPRDR